MTTTGASWTVGGPTDGAAVVEHAGATIHTPGAGAPVSESGRWRAASVRLRTGYSAEFAALGLIETLERHNARVGSWLQRMLHRIVWVWLLSPLAYLLLRALFRVRVEGKQHLAPLGGRAIYAFRHYWEWDPFVVYYLLLFPRGVFQTHLVPVSLVGRFWMRTRLRRAFAWWCGLLGLVPRAEPEGAIARAADLLRSWRRLTVAIFPTGPTGRAANYEVKPGVGYLAARCPEVPVVPVWVDGPQHMSWRSVLLLKRPPLTIRVCPSFTAAELAGGSAEQRAHAISERVAKEWEKVR